MFPNERSWSIKDPDVVWKEMLEFLGKRNHENSKIIYDVEQHNYVVSLVFLKVETYLLIRFQDLSVAIFDFLNTKFQ